MPAAIDRRKPLDIFREGGQRDSVKMMMMKMFMPSMPSMPGGGEEKKEETAESREEAKEQVVNDMNIARIANAVQCYSDQMSQRTVLSFPWPMGLQGHPLL